MQIYTATLNMLHIMYLWIPMVIDLVITLPLMRLNVESENRRLKAGDLTVKTK